MNKVRALLVFIIIVLISGCTKQTQQDKTKTETKDTLKPLTQNDKDLAAAVDKFTDSVLAAGNQPGMIISITCGDKVIYEKGKGLAILESKTPMESGMRFKIGSVTKTFTTTVLLQLVDEGRLKLDDSIDKFFPNVPNAKNITVRMLGDMSSGIYNYTDAKEFEDSTDANPLKKWKPEELVEIGTRNKPYFEPGKDWHYSNTTTVMLGMIIEKLTGSTLAKEIKSRICDKLGLKQTYLQEGTEMPGNHSHGYIKGGVKGDSALIDVTEKFNASWAWAAGAIISDVKDLKIYLKALAEGTLISKAMHQERLKWKLDKPDMKYGFGIYENRGFFGHNGSTPGFDNMSVHSPSKGCTVVIFYNAMSNHGPDALLNAIIPLMK